MLLPLPLVLIAAFVPPLVLNLFKLRPHWIMLGAAGAWLVLAFATFAMAQPPAGPRVDTHPVEELDFSGFEAFLFLALALAYGLCAFAQWIKSRLTGPDSTLTMSGFWMAHAGLIAALGLGDAAPAVMTLATTIAFAGVLVLVHAILIRPLIRRLRRPA